jgi:exodeoxyribonuclease VII small subunit
MTMSDPLPEPPSFEAALQRLEQIVRQLEQGELSLDASISLYEEGQRLRGLCEAQLTQARARIELIQQGSSGEAVATRPFGEG